MNKIYNKDFINARLTFYLILIIEFVYLVCFSNFECIGCPLCGMTRAVKSLLILDFKSAFRFNHMVWIFCILIPLIMIDLLIIFRHKFIVNKNNETQRK